MIKVLIVDDSALMRKIIRDILERQPEIEVVGTAKDGLEAIEMAETLNPDVVTLDVEMPKMNGLETLSKIINIKPIPVIMVSALTTKDASITIQALMNGAVDFITKPNDLFSNFDSFAEELKTKIIYIVKSKRRFIPSVVTSPKGEGKYPGGSAKKLVIIGASTGGPQALYQILSRLSPLPDVSLVVIQHMPTGFTKSLAERLNSASRFLVKEADEGEALKSGVVYVAPGGYHLVIDGFRFSLTKDPPIWGVRPAVDISMMSGAQSFKEKTVGILLTGMGVDGARGMEEIKKLGGRTIAQDERSCVVFGMPKAAIEKGVVDKIVELDSIPSEIEKVVSEI
ncbi:MAG: protein-glutamate methylesterase/protein-glutamine glutaminase [bacterium]